MTLIVGLFVIGSKQQTPSYGRIYIYSFNIAAGMSLICFCNLNIASSPTYMSTSSYRKATTRTSRLLLNNNVILVITVIPYYTEGGISMQLQQVVNVLEERLGKPVDILNIESAEPFFVHLNPFKQTHHSR